MSHNVFLIGTYVHWNTTTGIIIMISIEYGMYLHKLCFVILWCEYHIMIWFFSKCHVNGIHTAAVNNYYLAHVCCEINKLLNY